MRPEGKSQSRGICSLSSQGYSQIVFSAPTYKVLPCYPCLLGSRVATPLTPNVFFTNQSYSQCLVKEQPVNSSDCGSLGEVKRKLVNPGSHSDPFSEAATSLSPASSSGKTPRNFQSVFFPTVQFLIYFLQLCGYMVNPSQRTPARGTGNTLVRLPCSSFLRLVGLGSRVGALPHVVAQATDA